MIEYFRDHPGKITGPLTEHIELVLITLVISLVIASILTLLAMRSERISDVLNHLFSVIYSVPSLALFALLIPVTGLGRTSAVIVLTLYNQYNSAQKFHDRASRGGSERLRGSKGDWDDGYTDSDEGQDSAGPQSSVCGNPSGCCLYDRNRYDSRLDQCGRSGYTAF